MSDETKEPTPHAPVEINMSKLATAVVIAVVAWVGYSIHNLTESVGTITVQMTKMGSTMEHHAKTLEKWEDALVSTQAKLADLKETFRDEKHARSERVTKLEHIVSVIQQKQTNQTNRVSSVDTLKTRLAELEALIPAD